MCALQGLLTSMTDGPSEEPRGAGISQPSSLPAQLSTRFGDYELLEMLARGGMGVVYKARQVSLNRTVALKMIQAGLLATPAEVKRFQAEAEAIAHLQHPNIVAVHEIGQHDGQHFFSMDYVAGRTLAEIVRDGPLPATRAAAYVKTIAGAVHYAHQHGILHRDLKPANIIIDENDQPRITDFGLAKKLTDSQLSTLNPQLTLSGQVLGSPNYLPPEQADPEHGTIGPPSDVYALGAILYHLVTGRPPFQAESLTTLLRQVIESDPVAPRLLNPGIPRDLETICLKCLEKEPQRRYATAQALADDLGRFLNREPVLARPVGASGRAWRWCRRRPVLAGLAAALVVVLFGGMIGISWQWQRAEHERGMAMANEQTALRLAYAGDMNLVVRCLEEGDLGRARGLLDRYRPNPAPSTLNPQPSTDVRGWEWRYLWGLCQGDEHSILTRSSNAVIALAASPDGELLAARRSTGEIELWDWPTRQRTATLDGHGWNPSMSFTADGRFLVFANREPGDKPVVSFWEVSTRQIVHRLPQPAEVRALSVSPDGKRLATCHWEKSPRHRIWEISSGKLFLDLPSVGGPYNGTSPIPLFSPDGSRLALGETSGQIRLLNVASAGTNILEVPVPGEGISALAFSSDGNLLASAYAWSDTGIYLWDATTGQRLGRLDGHRRYVSKLVFALDGRTLYSASGDETVGVWDVPGRKLLRRLQGHTSGLSGLALVGNARRLVSSASDGSIRLWELPAEIRPQAKVILPHRSIGVWGSVFTADSRRLITVSRTEPVTIWEAGTTNALERISALGTKNQGVALSADQRLLAVGGCDGTIKIWDLKSHSLTREWQPHAIPVYRLHFLDCGKSLLSGCAGGGADLKRWEVGSWRELSFGPVDREGVYGVTVSPDQKLLVLSYTDKPVKVWDAATGRLQAALGSEGGFTPNFSADGRLLTAAVRSSAKVWEVGSWRRVAVLQQLGSGTMAANLSADGRRVAAGSIETDASVPTVHIWDPLVERELLSLRSLDRWTGWVEFSPDGNTLLAVSWFGLTEMWRAPSWEEIAAAEKRQPIR